MAGSLGLTPESLKASGRSSEKLSLPTLQSKIKRDPEGYETELQLIYKQFKASVDLFHQQAALSFSSSVGSDPSSAKDLGDRVMFLAHVTPFYPNQLAPFPAQLIDLLRTSCLAMPSSLRTHVAQALVLLMNRKSLVIEDLLALFLDLQTLGDKNLRKLAFSHIVQTIRKMSVTDPRHRSLQQIVISMLEQKDETKAKRALVTLCELYKRKVWLADKNDRVAIAICEACFHDSSRIMISALRFLINFENVDNDDDDSDASSGDDEETIKTSQPVINREAVYKATNKGTSSSKKKKKAKLQRAMRSIKKKQRSSSENTTSTYSPLNHLNDAQKFAEGLFTRLQAGKSGGKTCERFETRLMMIKVIARTIGLHKLHLSKFYSYLERYAMPGQRDSTQILAAAIQSCHDGVPSDAVEPLFKKIVSQFVGSSEPEAVAVGLNVIREMCLRIRELMEKDMLQYLALFKKPHEKARGKAISAAARSLIALFNEINPLLLVKKVRDRPVGPVAKPKQYGEANVFSNVPNVELLQESNHESGSDGDQDDDDDAAEFIGYDDVDQELIPDDCRSEEEADKDSNDGDCMNNTEADSDINTSVSSDKEEENNDSDEAATDSENEEIESNEDKEKAKGKKRKIEDFDANLLSADTHLRALKRFAKAKSQQSSSFDENDGILSNEDFRRIKELQAKKEAKLALARIGIKIPDSDELSKKRVDPAKLEAHIRHKLTKEQKLELVKAGRDDREKYRSKAAIKKNKKGGLSNKQKEHKKNMPLAAIRSKVGKSKRTKKMKNQGSQFRGRKAWK